MNRGRRVQLHRALSKLGWGSRKQGWDWIRAGAVSVDGQTITDPLTWVDLDRQAIACRDCPAVGVPRITLALNKPRGVVTTRRDEHGRPTVYDLLPADLPWIFPAGRLDADSEGLLILTNDSQLSVRLTDPEHHVPKTYRVTIRGTPDESAIDRLRHGIRLAEGMTLPAQVEVAAQHMGRSIVTMVLTQGLNRQIRRMWAAVGHKVKGLQRIAIGDYQLGDLPPGKWTALDDSDQARLLRTNREHSGK
jgi:pseudouridine synthase